MKPWALIGLALSVASPVAVGAQERGRVDAGPRVFELSFSRGRIGVVVKTDADAQADRVGARVEAVTPGGPADKAGLKAGDVITHFNGAALGGAEAAGGRESGPGLQLIRLARALEPGDTVRVAYRRGTDARNTTLVAVDIENAWEMALPRPPLPGDPRERPDARQRVEEGFPRMMLWGSPWLDLELVSLNADLGEYFGTREGVLVVKASPDESLPLKGGDVILSIDGREPTTPGHAMRILRSYAAGESVKIEIRRKQRRQTVTWIVQQREEGLFHRERRGERGLPF
jgi:S1-C subfamily serine protease